MPHIRFLATKFVVERTKQGRFNGTTPRTVSSILTRFCELVDGDREPTNLTRRDFERWLERPLALTTKRNEFSIVCSWARWMVESGYLRRDPTLGVRGPRQPRSVPHRVDDDQVSTLLAHVPDARAEAMVMLMSESALRCCEIAALQVGDVDLFNMTLLVTGKGGHQRVVPLCDNAADAIRRYLAGYPAAGGPLFRSFENNDKGLTAGYVSDRIRRWMCDAGLRPEKVGKDRGKYPSAHWMRHGAAQAIVANGAHPRTVQSLLGHASLATTSQYTGLASVEDMRKVMQQREYRPVRAVRAVHKYRRSVSGDPR